MNEIQAAERRCEERAEEERLARAKRMVRELEAFLATGLRGGAPGEGKLAGGWRWPVRYNRLSSAGRRA